MATYRQRNVPTVEAHIFDDSWEFHEWAQVWGFEFQYTKGGIRFRVKQTMAAEEWRTVQHGEWVIWGVEDFYTMDAKYFDQHYEIIE